MHDEKVLVPTTKCQFCLRAGAVWLDPDQYDRWLRWSRGDGGRLQEVLHDVPPAEREQLLNGSHGECFDAAFREVADGE